VTPSRGGRIALQRMSDISFHIGWLELALIFGWPGLILGAGAGALIWRKRRFAGALLGAVLGGLAWFAIAFALKLS